MLGKESKDIPELGCQDEHISVELILLCPAESSGTRAKCMCETKVYSLIYTLKMVNCSPNTAGPVSMKHVHGP